MSILGVCNFLTGDNLGIAGKVTCFVGNMWIAAMLDTEYDVISSKVHEVHSFGV